MDTTPRAASLPQGDDKTHNEAKTRELAEAYVAGRLSQPESDAFEEHFFACAECWDDVQTLQRFRDGIRHASFAAPGSNWKWAFAAAALGLIGFVSWTMLVQIPRLEGQLAQVRNVPTPVLIARAQPNLPLLMLEASRADTAPALTVPSGAERFAIWLDAPPSAPGPFRLDVFGGTERIESLPALTPNSHGALTAAVPSDKLPPGKYTARLFGANGALAGEYKFEIRR